MFAVLTVFPSFTGKRSEEKGKGRERKERVGEKGCREFYGGCMRGKWREREETRRSRGRNGKEILHDGEEREGCIRGEG